jgi:hypothetical protein
LISTSVHLQAAKTKTYLKATKIFSALVPFLAIFATGQGFAAAAAMTIGAYGNNKKTGHLSLFSSVLSGMAFFSLGYARQDNNNPIAWSSHHFFLLATSSLPENHSIFLIICILLGIWTLQVRLGKKQLLIVLQPTIFAPLFAAMTTLSRSSYGLYTALISRYTTCTILIPINLLIVLMSQSQAKSRWPASALAISLMFTIAPGIQSNWWDDYDRLTKTYVIRIAQMQNALQTKGEQGVIGSLWFEKIEPPPRIVDYLSGSMGLRGWHLQAAKVNSNLNKK